MPASRLSLGAAARLAIACAPLLVAMAAGTVARPKVVSVGGAGAPSGPDAIAYIKDRREVRLVDADGGDDRLVFRVPPDAVYLIQDVAWRPDGKQLAFVSGHEALCSAWQYDIYLIDPDGSNLERLTNGPECAGLAGLPTGSVNVTIDNFVEGVSPFFVYVEGAPEARQVTLEAGFSGTLTIDGVADLGTGVPQTVVAVNGSQRWFSPGVSADVQPGTTVAAGTLDITAGGAADTWGALMVCWSPNGSRLGVQLGLGALWQVPADVAPLAEGAPLLEPAANQAVSGTDMAWSPTGDEILYTRFDESPSTITLTHADGAAAGDPLATVTLSHGVAWLPDGSGFVASDSTALLDGADLYLYTFADRKISKLTSEPGFSLWPSVSPDGRHVVYSYSPVPLGQATSVQLRVRSLVGSDDRLLLDNGLNPDWR